MFLCTLKQIFPTSRSSLVGLRASPSGPSCNVYFILFFCNLWKWSLDIFEQSEVGLKLQNVNTCLQGNFKAVWMSPVTVGLPYFEGLRKTKMGNRDWDILTFRSFFESIYLLFPWSFVHTQTVLGQLNRDIRKPQFLWIQSVWEMMTSSPDVAHAHCSISVSIHFCCVSSVWSVCVNGCQAFVSSF